MRSMNANIDLPVHGLFPLSDGIARTMAGNIVAGGAGASWSTMPGGWATLAGGARPSTAPVAPAAPAAAPVTQMADRAAQAPAHAATTATAIMATASASGSGSATGTGTAATASWASMPGGWQSLRAIGVTSDIANHGNYPLTDGVARTAAGNIVP